MIHVRLNGRDVSLPAGSTVSDLLHAEGLANRRVAIECNREIVPKSQHASHPLSDGDQLELVHALGGG